MLPNLSGGSIPGGGFDTRAALATDDVLMPFYSREIRLALIVIKTPHAQLSDRRKKRRHKKKKTVRSQPVRMECGG